jgi:hypothetical protein
MIIFISLSIVKIIVSCSYCALFVPPNLLHPTKSNLYMVKSLTAAGSKPALYRLLTFQVPKRMPFSAFENFEILPLETPHPR